MSEYEDIVELGFEGIDKFAHKYHDSIYAHLPGWKKKQQDQQKRNVEQQAQNQPQSSKEQRTERHDSIVGSERGQSRNEPEMSSYGYDRRQDYRDDREPRFDQYQPQASSPPPGYGYDDRYNEPRAYDDQYHGGYGQVGRQLRPEPQRQRSSSWSPREERRGRDRDDDSRRRRRSRSRSGPNFRDADCSKRLAAAAIGAFVGGYAANKFTKGQKFDTAATIGGAVLGGIASREIADRVGHRKEDKREKREDKEEAWEEKWGKDSKGHEKNGRLEYRDDYDRDDRRRIRDS